ncbi:MAG: phosphoribosylamine--glycine ligase [Spirochaetia bacterium]|nr:phosphoribosylamine--glycine ligase [Spirochaetia bacterium]
MKVLLLGSGGREHALFWKLSQSPRLTRLDVAPGNGGFPSNVIRKDAPPLSDIPALAKFIQHEKYELVVVGPEQPLVDGITDALKGICPVFGPSRLAAQLEGSKDFAKSFMMKYGIPTAQSRTFTKSAEAVQYLDEVEARTGAPFVIKADGLAAGKGVVVAATKSEAVGAIQDSLDHKKFGGAGARVLVEDFLKGTEASIFALCDGERALPFVAAKDHKRAFDGDKGPNTGGMGAFTPASVVTPSVLAKVQKLVFDPVIRGMKAEGAPYRGLLYAGLMIHNGEPSVVEFNVRFGDPETQALLRLLDEDLLELCHLCAAGTLPDRPLKFLPGSALVVVLAAQGYPDEYLKGIALKNLDKTQGDIITFHAGTRREGNSILSNGGRVLGVTATGRDLEEARKKVYGAMENIAVSGTFYRKDIGVI